MVLLYDLIFPLFLFIVGLAIPFSLSKYNSGSRDFKSSRAYGYIRIITRTITLLLLGFIVNGFFDFNFSSMRWPGAAKNCEYVILSLLL